jgi:hypothetical protein
MMNDIPVVNIDDANAQDSLSQIIHLAGVNAVLDGECELEDLEDLDTDKMAHDIVAAAHEPEILADAARRRRTRD